MKKLYKVKGPGFTLIRGSCYRVFPLMRDSQVDFWFQDPPYTVRAKNKAGNIKFKTREDINLEIDKWDRDYTPTSIVFHLLRILKRTGNFASFCAYHQDYHTCLDKEFDTFIPFYWHRSNPPPSVRKSSFRMATEIVVLCYNKGHTFNFLEQKEMLNYMITPICMGHERLKNDEGKTLHPTQKPLKVCRHLIKVLSNPGDVVFDPFMGAATSGVAALQLGRKYIGIEKRPDYFQAAVERIRSI